MDVRERSPVHHGQAPQIDLGDTRRRAVSALAHQLRTPLSLVAAPLELLVASGTLDQDAARQVALARDNVGRLREDVERLVEVAAWPTTVDLADVDLADVLAGAVSGLEPDAAAAGVELRLDVSDSVTDARLHPGTTSWALEILLSAHVGRATAGDAVVVRAGTGDAAPSIEVSIDCAHIEVSIDCVHAGGHPTTSTDRSRLVAIARDLLALEGVSTTIDERIRDDGPPHRSEGSVRRVDATIPVPAGAVPEPLGVPLTVLVVEDDDQLRDFLDRALSADHDVVAVGTGEAALASARQVRPDIVICDIMLPGHDGEELVHELEQLEGMSDVPIMVLSGRTDEALRVRLLQDGADDYVTKPFAVDELRARMANLAATHLDSADLRRRAEQARVLADQLQHALDSRVVIEQAKAFVAAQDRIGLDQAFDRLRRFARSNNLRLRDVAQSVVDGNLQP